MTIEIVKEEGPTGGRYFTVIEDVTCELTYSMMAGSGNVIADHTGVPRALGGRGIGRALVDALIADARQNGFKIVPLCPFVRAQYARHPEWADVML